MTVNFIKIILITMVFTGCSPVTRYLSSSTKTEVKEIPVPEITAKEIPGIYQREIPFDSMYTGEVITGEVKDSSGSTIAVISYRPKNISKAQVNDSVGTFTAIVKPAPVKAEVKIETTEIKNVKEKGLYDVLLVAAGIMILILIIKVLGSRF